MLKRKPLILCMLVIAMVALFGTTAVMAQTADCPLNTSVTSNDNQSTWTLTAVPGPDDADVKTFPYPVDIGDETWYKYDYDLNEHVDHMYLAIPHNCQDPIKILEGELYGGVEYKDPAEGDAGWAEGVFTVRLLVIPTNSNRVSYIADRDVLGEGSVFFSHGKKNYVGQNSIVTVGYQAEDYLIKNTEEYRWIGPKQIRLLINYRDCTFTAYDTANPSVALHQFPVTDLKIAKGTADGQNINEAWTHGKCEQVTFHAGENSCAIYILGGYAFQICWP